MLARRLGDADILATDASKKRLTHMKARLRRFPYAERVRCEVMDASAAASDAEAKFDLILCDVPCSGTGTLARNPEIRHHLRVEDFARQATRQRAILGGALRRLAPGGRLVYSTCSLEPEENEAVVDSVMDSIGGEMGLQRISVTPLLANLSDSGVLGGEAGAALIGSAVRDGALRTLPGSHQCDGFYAIVLERR
jgi:16S rRNA (cytosine967-C5)-methyltransferase